MFDPPRCPNVHCAQHRDPAPRFYTRHGAYRSKCRPHPVPRFICKSCGKGFSRQTFRMDYHDHKPHLNARLFELLSSGVGLRQAARMLHLSNRCTELKARKIARHLWHVNRNLPGTLDGEFTLLFDEMETYEGRRNTRPLTVPCLIELDSRFIFASKSAPIRPRGKMTKKRRAAIEAEERLFGPRRDGSRACCLLVLKRGAKLFTEGSRVVIRTDEKVTYPASIERAFRGIELVHETTNSKLARGTWNPLFHINHTDAMSRDLMSRMRRESWLASKKGWCLDLHLQIHIAYRNYIRMRFNWDKETAAQILGFVDRPMQFTELLSWRQDWSSRSIHPLGRRNESVAEYHAAA